jgi:lysozyme
MDNKHIFSLDKKGFDLIKSFEGLSLKAYVDPGTGNMPITIGYGSTMKADGSRFKLGDTIGREEAENLLFNQILYYAKGVDNLTRDDITQHQFNALVSFSYNCGLNNLKSSTLLKYVNINPNDPCIENEFLKWVRAGGKVMKGLITRRTAEANMYKTI